MHHFNKMSFKKTHTRAGKGRGRISGDFCIWCLIIFSSVSPIAKDIFGKNFSTRSLVTNRSAENF